MKMTRILSLSLSIGLIISLASCSEPKSNIQTKIETPEEQLDDRSLETVTIDSATENRYAYLKEVFKSNGDNYIAVDYVSYLTGKEALDAEWRDEAYFIDGTDTITNITDGYYISNINKKLRTFRISKDATIENIIDDHGPHKIEEEKILDVEQLKKYIAKESLLFIHIQGGIVISIDEQFRP